MWQVWRGRGYARINLRRRFVLGTELNSPRIHELSTGQYIERVAWSATIYRLGKHHLESPSAALKAIGCEEAEWQEQLNAVRCGWRVVGGSVQMRELAQRIGQQRFKRRSRRPGPDRDAPPRMESG